MGRRASESMQTTTITDPAGNQTVMQTSNGAAIQATAYQGTSASGTLLQTVTTCYNASAAPCSTPTGPPSSAPPAAITLITLPRGGKSTQVVSYVTSQNLPTEIDTYDFGSSSPTQKELIAYASLSNGINNKVTCDQVVVGTTAPSSCGTVTSNTKSLSTATYDSLGNLLGTSSWVSGVSSPQFLSQSYLNYSNGLLEKATDVNGNPTTYGYQNCNNTPAYPSSISSGGLTTYLTWDCNGGVITQAQDVNSQPTSFGYLSPPSQGSIPDPFWRVLSITDPLGNVTWNRYGATTEETALVFNNSSSTSDVLLTLDGLGRLAMSQVRTAPGSSTFDNTVTYGYGWNSTGPVTGQLLTQTIAGGTALASTQLDPLGRVATTTDGGGLFVTTSYIQNDALTTVAAPIGENAKMKQVEHDALGRVTSVCEITSTLPGSGKCSQSNPNATGYFTTYTYDNPVNSMVVTQNATGPAQTRTYQYDGVGRLISETNPEWGPGTTYYTYDTDATCGTSNGDLVKKVDSAGNVVCYSHDALHRVTGIMYPCSSLYAGMRPLKISFWSWIFRQSENTSPLLPA